MRGVNSPPRVFIVNRQSSIVNRQSSIVNRQSSIVNRKSIIGVYINRPLWHISQLFGCFMDSSANKFKRMIVDSAIIAIVIITGESPGG